MANRLEVNTLIREVARTDLRMKDITVNSDDGFVYGIKSAKGRKPLWKALPPIRACLARIFITEYSFSVILKLNTKSESSV